MLAGALHGLLQQQSPRRCSPAHRTYPGRSVPHVKTTLSPHLITEPWLFFNLALCIWSISTPSASLLGTTCSTSRYTQRAHSFVQGQPHVTEQREGTWSSGTSLSQLEMLIIMAIERSGEGMIIFSTSFLPCSPKVWAVEGADVLPVTTAIPCQIWVKVLTQRLLHRSFVCSSRTWKVTSKWWKLVNTKIWTVWWESLVLQVIDDVSSVFI